MFCLTYKAPPRNFHFVLIVAACVDKSGTAVVKVLSNSSICFGRE